MTLHEAVELLFNEGLPATKRRLLYALSESKLRKPPKDSSGRFVVTEEHLRVWRVYFKNPPKPGPRRKA